MRARYLKAVLRQEVSYFDLHVTSTSEVITSVSNDAILIQDVIAEKVRGHDFIMLLLAHESIKSSSGTVFRYRTSSST